MIRMACTCALLFLSASTLLAQSQKASGASEPRGLQPKLLLKRALKCERSIEEEGDRSLALMNLAPLQAQAGDMEGTSSSLQLLTKDEDRDMAVAGIAMG